MSYTDISKSLSDIERKVTKSNKIIAKGGDLNYKDAIKLGTKSQSICSTIKKGIKEYGVSTRIVFESKDAWSVLNVHRRALTPPTMKPRSSWARWARSSTSPRLS